MSDTFKINQDPTSESEAQIQKTLQEAELAIAGGIKKALRKYKKTTDDLRQKSLSSRGTIVNMSNTAIQAQSTLESILNKSATDLDYNEQAMKAIMSQIGIFITNTKKADVKRVSTEANKLKKWLRELKLVGAKQDENYNDFISVLRGTGSVKGLVSNSQKRAIKERVLKEDDTRLIFDETFLKENTSISELLDKSVALVKEELQAFVDVLSRTEDEEDRANLAKSSVGLSLDNLINKEATKKDFTFIVVYYYTKNIAGTRKKVKKNMRVSQTTFSKSVVKSKSRYAIFKIECKRQDSSKAFLSVSSEGEIDNIEFSAGVDSKTYFDTGSENAKKVWTSKTSGTIYNPLISKLVQNTLEDKPIFQFGHVVSLAQKQMHILVKTLKELAIPEELKETNFYKNFSILKGNIILMAEVAKNVDTIFADWVDSDELISGADLVTFIENNDIEADVTFLKKVGTKVTPSGQIKSIKETIEIDGEVKATGRELEGIMEPDKVNNIKAVLLKRLKNLMIKQLEQNLSGDIIKQLSKKEILALTIKKRSDSPLDTIIKFIFPGIKIKKGKRTRTDPLEKVNISYMKAKRFRLKEKKSVIQPNNIKVKPPKEKVAGTKSVNTTEDTTSSKKVKKDINLISAVNAEVGSEVKKLMGYPRLVNRSGRFASSVKVTTLSGRQVTFSYQRNPYSIFDKNYGKAPWNSLSSRDPYEVISEAITKILRRYDRAYASTAVIREG